MEILWNNAMDLRMLLTEWKARKVNKETNAGEHSLYTQYIFRTRKRIKPSQDPFNWFHWCHLSHFLLPCHRCADSVLFLFCTRFDAFCRRLKINVCVSSIESLNNKSELFFRCHKMANGYCNTRPSFSAIRHYLAITDCDKQQQLCCSKM